MILNLIILVLVILAIDFYGYYGLRKLLAQKPVGGFGKWIFRAYWFLDIGFIVFSLVWTIIIRTSAWDDYIQYRNFFYITGAFIFIFLPKITFLIFNVLHDICLALTWLIKKITQPSESDKIKKTPVILTLGFALSLFTLIWVFYGVAYGRYNFEVTETEIEIEDLPDAFDGFRIVQISDTHLGSFARQQAVHKGVKKIMATPHDVLVFTGDMVNNEAIEAEKFVEYFAAIESPYGKFSILGNHDMGDYRRWYTIEEKSANLLQLEEFHSQMGFDILRNKHRFVKIGNDSIMIAGVDNWGLPPFAQLGDIDEALGPNADFPFIVLLSHDPSHWTEEVIPNTDIMLTLSGHTHGMQAGIRTPWFQWSPVSIKYENWGGLYSQESQYIYVNRGFGFIGFPGRMGMRPEITVITLRKK